MQKEREEKIIKQLFKDVLNYYKKLMKNTSENAELTCQDNIVEDVQVCFRVMCQNCGFISQGTNISYWKISQFQKKLKEKAHSNSTVIKRYAEDLQDTCEEMQKQLENSNSQIILLK
ncbi:unnamed protein product [Paramecium octaurelia]|uniref:Uncharacterized protein n=1 Tax=Paramecium octaurelia TaxID=43137 RepID=A0A8S1TMI6_PAROT|nr:unnamed protein product [Paramecium octaurelia]